MSVGPPPRTYEIHLATHLDDHWASWLGELVIDRLPDGTCTLRGAVADQAQLHGILGRVRDSGAVLLAVRVVGEA